MIISLKKYIKNVIYNKTTKIEDIDNDFWGTLYLDCLEGGSSD